jgi:cupin superfamily acireductone dioxygenase involved in methionine salvage
MDISEELNEIKIGLNNPQTVLDSLLKQRDEFNKKIHIFIVLNIANAIKEMIDSNMFQEHDIASINISHKYNDEIFTNFIDFKLFDSNSNKIEYVLSSAEKFQLKQRLTD